MASFSRKAWRTAAVAFASAACFTAVLIVGLVQSGERQRSSPSDSLSLTTLSGTLVVYIFADTDPEYLENLKFFVEWGIDPDDDAEFIVVVQNIASELVGCRSFVHALSRAKISPASSPSLAGVCSLIALFCPQRHFMLLSASRRVLCLQQDTVLPDLPKNAKYVQHNNECYDWGTFAWLLLQSGSVRLSKYKYIVLTNSSVRGPYMPPYIPVSESDKPSPFNTTCCHGGFA